MPWWGSLEAKFFFEESNVLKDSDDFYDLFIVIHICVYICSVFQVLDPRLRESTIIYWEYLFVSAELAEHCTWTCFP